MHINRRRRGCPLGFPSYGIGKSEGGRGRSKRKPQHRKQRTAALTAETPRRRGRRGEHLLNFSAGFSAPPRLRGEFPASIGPHISNPASDAYKSAPPWMPARFPLVRYWKVGRGSWTEQAKATAPKAAHCRTHRGDAETPRKTRRTPSEFLRGFLRASASPR